MPSLRYDSSHGAAPSGFSRRPAREDNASGANIDSRTERAAAKGPESFLSIVVAAKNEAASLPRLMDEIALALRPLCGRGPRSLAGYEVIVVDDASTDQTSSVLEGLASAYTELRALVLAAGVGQSSATVAGIRIARGNWVATLDADLQNDPADLVRLWNALPGHDVALGWRVNREDTWSKGLISRWANRVRNIVLGQSIRDTGCSIRIFPRAQALHLPMFHGVHRFFGPLLLREGCRLIQVPVHDRPRRHGRSHYNLWNRCVQVVIDLFGVAWLMRRPVRCEVIQTWGLQGPTGDPESGVLFPARVFVRQEA